MCWPSAPPATSCGSGATRCAACAPEDLRRRCAAQRTAVPPPSRLRRWVPLSLAATLLLAVGGRVPLRLDAGRRGAGRRLDARSRQVLQGLAGGRRWSTPRKLAVSWQQSRGGRLTVAANGAGRRAAARRRAALHVVRGTSRASDVSLARRAAVGLRASARPRTRPHHGQHGARDRDLVRQRPHLCGACHRPSRTTSITSSATSRPTPSDKQDHIMKSRWIIAGAAALGARPSHVADAAQHRA